jgi:alanine racemase
VARVDLAALGANYAALEAWLARQAAASGRPAPAIIAVVKANAYGHGAARVARALEAAGARRFAVADIDEGVELRVAGVAGEVLVFGALGISDLAGVFEHRLTPTVSSPWAARALQAAAARRGVRLGCHLKIDTGMHRLGFRSDNLERTMPALASSPNLAVEAAYTHFATADDLEHPLFGEQQDRFATALDTLARLGIAPACRHAANSAALLRDERTWFDAVRVGLLLYGIVPPPLATTLPLRPVLSLSSRVVAVKGLRASDTVGYGARFVADGPRTLAIVPAGYADGVDWRLGGRGFALVRGTRVPVAGSVCMDMITLDVTGLEVAPGDEVVLLGAQHGERLDVREMAATIGTIPYELLCRLGSRIERRYE